jgi:hypothetical protein
MRSLILVCILATACGSSKRQDEPCDMSSDDKVAAIYQQLEGKEPDAGCIRRPAAFPQLAYAGTFADDAGCIAEVQIWKCKRSTENDAPAILQAAGWKTTDDAGREKIARDWLAIGGALMWTANAADQAAFAGAGKTFTAPKLTHDAGKLRIDGWFDYSQTTVGGEIRDYKFGAVELDADGKMEFLPSTDSVR